MHGCKKLEIFKESSLTAYNILQSDRASSKTKQFCPYKKKIKLSAGNGFCPYIFKGIIKDKPIYYSGWQLISRQLDLHHGQNQG